MRISFLSERKNIFFALSIVAVAALLMLGSIKTAQAGSVRNWELVYDHDVNGNPISGSLATLVAAIRNGADVHIVMHHPVLGDFLVKVQKVRVEVGGLFVRGLFSETYRTAANDLVDRVMTFQTDGTWEVIYPLNSGQENISEKVSMSWFVSQ